MSADDLGRRLTATIKQENLTVPEWEVVVDCAPCVALRSAFAGVGNWPMLAALLSTSGGLIATAGAMEAVWPGQPKSILPSDVLAKNVSGIDVSAFTPPQTLTVPVSYGGAAIGSQGNGVAAAAYTQAAAPQGMSLATFNSGIATGAIVAGSLSEYEQAIGKRFTGTPAQLTAFDQRIRQQYADAAAVGGTALAANGVRGVIVDRSLASPYGYQAASAQAIQSVQNDRNSQAQQRVEQEYRAQSQQQISSYTRLSHALNANIQQASIQRQNNGANQYGGQASGSFGYGGNRMGGGMRDGYGGGMHSGGSGGMNGMGRMAGGMGGGGMRGGYGGSMGRMGGMGGGGHGGHR